MQRRAPTSGGFGTGLRNGFSLRFTPDATRLVSAADNGAAIWDIVNGRSIRTFGDHGREVAAVDISPDGSRVLTGARDNTAKLWDAATGALLQTFAGPSSSVWGDVSWVDAVALSPSGDLAASGGTDHLVRVWDVKTGSQLHVLRSPLDYITVLAFSADGKRLLCGSWTARFPFGIRSRANSFSNSGLKAGVFTTQNKTTGNNPTGRLPGPASPMMAPVYSL